MANRDATERHVDAAFSDWAHLARARHLVATIQLPLSDAHADGRNTFASTFPKSAALYGGQARLAKLTPRAGLVFFEPERLWEHSTPGGVVT